MPKMAGKTIRRKRGLAQKEPTLPTPGFAWQCEFQFGVLCNNSPTIQTETVLHWAQRFQVHPLHGTYQYFIPFYGLINNVPLSGQATFLLPIHPSMDLGMFPLWDD
jgi:hypothetical protein